MPFINSKVSVAITPEQETEIKSRLGQVISLLPGKSEQWLMVGFEDNYHLYFRGTNDQPTAFVEVSVYGGENPEAFEKLTAAITDIFCEVLHMQADRIYIKYNAVSNWGWNGANL